MNVTYPLTIYFDASCRLCNSEMQNIKQHDVHNQFILIDCSASNFDITPYAIHNISLSDMMNRLHTKDAKGQWLIGVSAFEVIYQTIGMPSIAKLWGLSITRTWFYPLIAKHRYTLSLLGVPQLFDFFLRYMARKAEKRSRTCCEDNCTINN